MESSTSCLLPRVPTLSAVGPAVEAHGAAANDEPDRGSVFVFPRQNLAKVAVSKVICLVQPGICMAPSL